MILPPFETVAALGVVATLAGFFDAIAGGGGLVTVPALLLAGLDPVSAVATNKLQGSFGTVSATVAFARARRISWREVWPMMLAAGLGSMAGALAIRVLPGDWLAGLIPLLLIASALYFALAPKIREEGARRRMAPLSFTATLVPVIGFYDGFFGPGAGSFYMIGFVTLMGFGLVKATAHTKALNAASNLASLALYVLSGLVVWRVGLVMGAGAFLGAQLGSRLAMRWGARLIRPLLVTVCVLVALRLLLDPGNPLRRAVTGWIAAAASPAGPAGRPLLFSATNPLTSGGRAAISAHP
ncbi:MAG: TSUP family transporter [Alsobacter sp.]